MLAGLVAFMAIGARANLLRKIPFEKSGADLAAKSRELIRRFAYSGRPADSAQGFDYSTFLKYGQQREKLASFRAQLAAGQPSPIFFWYRESQGGLWSADGIVTENNPEETRPGMVAVNLDTEGRLTYFVSNPPGVDEVPDTPPVLVDWDGALCLGGPGPVPLYARQTEADVSPYFR